ncbi:MAG: hypothetical protein C0623_01425 [Desulfuromonas sp.]|nr:MAG: hypothetical protein C0623_01425 [Desulfuromonas sp.]
MLKMDRCRAMQRIIEPYIETAKKVKRHNNFCKLCICTICNKPGNITPAFLMPGGPADFCASLDRFLQITILLKMKLSGHELRMMAFEAH